MKRQAVIRTGVAGWDYPDWKAVLYPSPRPAGFDPVRFLANYIDLIEINSTFYRPVRPEVADRWADRVQDLPHFRYTAKLWRRFTHERDTTWSRDEVRQVKAGFDRLYKADRLDAVLLQFPWSFKNDEQNREWLDDLIETFQKYPLVVEIRHASWNEPAFYDWLSRHSVGFVNVDQPQFSKSIKPSARGTSHNGYIRVHGRNYKDWFRKDAGRDARYDYLYETKELLPWAKRADVLAEESKINEVDVVFNNHYKAQAVVNAIQFKHLLTGEVQPAPPLLFEHYPEALDGHAFPMDVEETADIP
jgi:uncharacterized protein YecE (DUF72 family)